MSEYWLDRKWVELNAAPISRTTQATRFYPSDEYDALAEKLKQTEAERDAYQKLTDLNLSAAESAIEERDRYLERIRELEAENEKHRWRLVGAQVDPTIEVLSQRCDEYEKALELYADGNNWQDDQFNVMVPVKPGEGRNVTGPYLAREVLERRRK